MIHVCSLSRLHKTVEDTGAQHIVTFCTFRRSARRAHIEHGRAWQQVLNVQVGRQASKPRIQQHGRGL